MHWQHLAATTLCLWPTLAMLLACLVPHAHCWSSPVAASQWTPYGTNRAPVASSAAAVVATARLARSSLSPSSSSSSSSSSSAATASLSAVPVARKLNEVSPYIDLVLCPVRTEPWNCARQQSARILDVWDGELYAQWQKLKVEADRQLNATLEKRGYSATELPVKEKPSTLLKKIEIGTNFMKEYLAETMDGFLGREYEPLQSETTATSENEKPANKANHDDDDDDVDDADDNNEDDENDEDETVADNETEDGDSDSDEADDAEEEEDDEEETDADNAANETPTEHDKNNAKDPNAAPSAAHATSTATDDVEFIEIEEAHEANAAAAVDTTGQLKRPGGRGGNRKQKRKKKKGGAAQPSTLVVVQAAEHGPEHKPSWSGGQSKPIRKKRRGNKRKKGQHGGETVIVEHEEPDTNHLGLGLLSELADTDDWFGSDGASGGGKHKHRRPIKYGRSNGVTRGKKKKKKKALAKLVFLGTFLKAKIELLLKVLGAHLQIKFFAIALIGLLINIARFWIDVKRGGTPQKVVYVEHAHHQHHYEDHGEDWSEPGGSYWKRSLHTDSTLEDADSATDSYQLRPQQQNAHYLAYRNQWQ